MPGSLHTIARLIHEAEWRLGSLRRLLIDLRKQVPSLWRDDGIETTPDHEDQPRLLKRPRDQQILIR